MADIMNNLPTHKLRNLQKLFSVHWFLQITTSPSTVQTLGKQERGSTYPLVQVDGVLARHHVGDGRAGLLAGLDVGHLCWGLAGRK